MQVHQTIMCGATGALAGSHLRAAAACAERRQPAAGSAKRPSRQREWTAGALLHEWVHEVQLVRFLRHMMKRIRNEDMGVTTDRLPLYHSIRCARIHTSHAAMTRSFDLCSPSDSVANTTKAALKNAVQQATLLGTPDTPTTTAAAKKSSRAAATASSPTPCGAGRTAR